jgi:DNA-binding transcriptional regulator YdaS (Cro superfamily)
MNLSEYISTSKETVASLSRKLNTNQVLVSQWKNCTRRVPAERCPSIERATGGLVRCEDLRPDVDWAYLRGAAPIPNHFDCAASPVSGQMVAPCHATEEAI